MSGNNLNASSRFVLSTAASEDTRKHSSAQLFTPRLMRHLVVTKKMDRPRTRGLVLNQLPGIFSFGSRLKIRVKISEIKSDTCKQRKHSGNTGTDASRIFQFSLFCCTDHDLRRLGVVWEHHPCVCRAETPHELPQVVEPAHNALPV